MTAAGAGVAMGRETIMGNVSSNDCEIETFDFADVKLRQLSPAIEILSYTATQDMTCQGQKLPKTVYSADNYVRQGDEWRTTPLRDGARVAASNAEEICATFDGCNAWLQEQLGTHFRP